MGDNRESTSIAESRHAYLIILFAVTAGCLLLLAVNSIAWHWGVTGYVHSPLLSYNTVLLIMQVPAFMGVTWAFLTSTSKVASRHRDKCIMAALIFYTSFGLSLALSWPVRYNVPFGIGDSWIHVSYADAIIESGSVNLGDNMYPAMHVLVSSLSLIASIDSISVMTWFPVIAPTVPALAYIICREFMGRLTDALLVIPIAAAGPLTTLSIAHVPTPYTFSVLLLMLLYWQVFAAGNRFRIRHLALAAALGLSLVVFHPVTAAFACSFLLLSAIRKTSRKKPRTGGKDVRPLTSSVSSGAFLLTCILSVATVAWLLFATELGARNLEAVFNSINAAFDETAWSRQTTISVHSLSNLVILRFGIIAYLTLATLAIITRWKRDSFRTLGRFNFILTYVVICALWYVLIQYFASRAAGVQMRFLYYALVMIPLPIMALYRPAFTVSLNTPSLSRASVIGLLITILTVLTVSLAVMFPSPEIDGYNNQTSVQEIAALDWFFMHIDKDNSSAMGLGDHLAPLASALFTDEDEVVVHGSTSGLISFMGLEPSDFTSRGTYETYDYDNPHQYIIFEPLMELFLAYHKYDVGKLTVSNDWIQDSEFTSLIFSDGEVCIYSVTQ